MLFYINHIHISETNFTISLVFFYRATLCVSALRVGPIRRPVSVCSAARHLVHCIETAKDNIVKHFLCQVAPIFYSRAQPPLCKSDGNPSSGGR